MSVIRSASVSVWNKNTQKFLLHLLIDHQFTYLHSLRCCVVMRYFKCTILNVLMRKYIGISISRFWMFVFPSVCLSVSTSVCLSVSMSVCLSVHLCMSVCLWSVCMFCVSVLIESLWSTWVVRRSRRSTLSGTVSVFRSLSTEKMALTFLFHLQILPSRMLRITLVRIKWLYCWSCDVR